MSILLSSFLFSEEMILTGNNFEVNGAYVGEREQVGEGREWGESEDLLKAVFGNPLFSNISKSPVKLQKEGFFVPRNARCERTLVKTREESWLPIQSL